MTTALTHSLRLLRWGRILGRHGALRLIEQDPNVPVRLRRLAWLARLGAPTPNPPRYAAAFHAIGPAAIKLGQALATRPDLLGAEVAADLLTLQDAVPAAPFEQVRASVERSLEGPLSKHFRSFDPEPVGAASVAQVHRAVTTDGRTVAVKVLRPGIEEDLARAIETYEWAARAGRCAGWRAAAAAPAPRHRPVPPVDAPRARSSPRGRVRLRARRAHGGRARVPRARD